MPSEEKTRCMLCDGEACETVPVNLLQSGNVCDNCVGNYADTLAAKVESLEQFRNIVAQKPCICKPNWNKCDSCRAKAAGGGA